MKITLNQIRTISESIAACSGTDPAYKAAYALGAFEVIVADLARGGENRKRQQKYLKRIIENPQNPDLFLIET